MIEFYREKEHVARKEHRCFLCGEKIKNGETHTAVALKFHGDFMHYRLHTSCAELVGTFCADYGDGEWTKDWIWDWIKEEYCYSCNQKETCERNKYRCEIILRGEKIDVQTGDGRKQNE